MNNQDFEKELGEYLANGGELIPASELGYDDSDFVVNAGDFYTQMYEMYKDSCHFKDSLNPIQSFEDHKDMTGKNGFACRGRVGFYNWYAVSLFFDKNIHKMSSEKEQFNKHHNMTMADDFMVSPGECLSKAINEERSLVNYFRNPFVANTHEIFNDIDWEIMEMETHLRHFLDIEMFPQKNVFTNNNGMITLNKETYLGKDIILPFIYATNKTLEVFGKFAKKIADTGANTVVGIFATRIVPTLDGKEGKISEEFRVRSFSPPMFINL